MDNGTTKKRNPAASAMKFLQEDMQGEQMPWPGRSAGIHQEWQQGETSMMKETQEVAKQYVEPDLEEALAILQDGVRMVDENLHFRIMIRKQDIPQAIAALPADARCTICYRKDPSKKPETSDDLCVITTVGNLIDEQSLSFPQYEKIFSTLVKFQRHPETIPEIPVIDRAVYRRMKEIIKGLIP